MNNQELAQVLRELADVYENNAELERPFCFEDGNSEAIYCHNKEQLAVAIRAFGAGTKEKTDKAIIFRPTRFPSIRVVGFSSGICERVVVGKRQIPATQAVTVRAHTIPAQPARTEEIFEWRCPESLLDMEEARDYAAALSREEAAQ